MINVKKVVALDENIIYPNCHVCGKELSPYQVEAGLSLTTFNLLKSIDLILGKLNDKLVVLFCNNCINLKEIKDEETT